MTTRPVLTNPNTDLRIISEIVSVSEIQTKEMKQLIEDLIETMNLENGVGIAAPQIGVHKRVIIIDTGDGPQAFINPKITAKSFAKAEGEEGCLSVPGVYGMVKRHKRITVQAHLPSGEEVEIKADDFPAIVFQHEMDHLDGVLFIDRVTRYTKPPKNVL